MLDPFIHLFTTPGGYYLYDINKNAILRLTEDQYKIIEDTQKSDQDDLTYNKQAIESINHLRELGFLSPKRPKEMYNPISETLKYHLNNKIKMITLQITRQCNLRCKYCVYSGNYENRGHENAKMSFETAKKGIDFLIEHSKDNERIFLAFYGGEPLLEFDFIKKCIEYYEEKGEGKETHITITTNATLLTEEIIDYFQKYGVYLLISLDGPSEVHNKNRIFSHGGKGTFEKVMENMEMIMIKFPDYLKDCVSFNAVLDPENDFSCVNNFFADFDMIKESQLMSTEISDIYSKDQKKASDAYISNLRYEYFKLFLSKVGCLDKKYTSKLIWRYYGKLIDTYTRLEMTKELPDKIHHGGPCIPGVQRLFMDVNGDFYPCERVSETSTQMRIGNVDTGFDVDKVETLLNIGKISEKQCVNCWALRFCNLCAAAADELDKLTMKKKITNCNAVRYSVENLLKDICTLREFGEELNSNIMDVADWKI
ncbi:Cys-rich peptide radical SAM maturase CcpM [Ruminiclostridium herbifermentans]|uniref:Cys-rich peptide radical SAM maturase CcpM n=1 Tax=Ruminiclostridium herbifermentans TaxID=2488810 RepID=A0A4U7JH14_9FIRM|nr:Cys-rich peptide radical SAM maturase CcpM [Ruminiclostridium herbifermentans]QNU67326.1 Cys-rich peptide radical SAM maturase CcpM [Ruminiclostridium herbifermentans]